MLLSRIRLWKDLLDKQRCSIEEGTDISQQLTNTSPVVTNDPFPHIVVDNFFHQEIHAKLVSYYKRVLERGLVEYDDPSYFKPFLNLKGEFAYDGYVYSPLYDEDPSLSLFFSNTWNLFFSQLFNQPTGVCTSLALHYHPKGNRTGFVHHDYAPKLFSEVSKAGNNIVYRERSTGLGTKLTKQIRVIALIYYIDINNENWMPGDGGETALYKDKNDAPIKLIEPKNNRLFAFQISPNSFHAFQTNKTPRASFIQWFHVDPTWCKNTYGFVLENDI